MFSVLGAGPREQDFFYQPKIAGRTILFCQILNFQLFSTKFNDDLQNLVQNLTLNHISQENTQLFISAQVAEWL